MWHYMELRLASHYLLCPALPRTMGIRQRVLDEFSEPERVERKTMIAQCGSMDWAISKNTGHLYILNVVAVMMMK